AACPLSSRAADAPLKVVTLHTVLTEIAREIGGNQVEVTGLVQPDADPHSYEPSPSDMRAIVDADVILASGLRLESYLDRRPPNARPHGEIVAVGDALPVVLTLPADEVSLSPLTQLRGGPKPEKDPHWWHSIDDVIYATEIVRGEFARLRPGSADLFLH